MDSQSSRTNSIGSAGEVPSLTVGGVRIDALSMEGAVRAILDPERSGAVHLCNAYTISLATKDVSLRQRLNRGALNLIDGMPLLWLARRRGFRDLNDRVSGTDIMASCLEIGRAHV